jgi:hypothetical protein
MGSEFVSDLELSLGRMQASWNDRLGWLQRGMDGAVAAGEMSSCSCPLVAVGEGGGGNDRQQGRGHASDDEEPDGLAGSGAMWSGHSQLAGREINYYCLEFVGKLHLQEWQCDCCGSVVSPRPSAFGCFPSTPKCASTWYNVQVLQLFRRLGTLDGLSATGERVRSSSDHDQTSWRGALTE